jgi:hypothetical protein
MESHISNYGHIENSSKEVSNFLNTKSLEELLKTLKDNNENSKKLIEEIRIVNKDREKKIWMVRNDSDYLEKIKEDLEISIAKTNSDFPKKIISDIIEIIEKRLLEKNSEIKPYTKYLLNFLLELIIMEGITNSLYSQYEYAISINTQSNLIETKIVLFKI